MIVDDRMQNMARLMDVALMRNRVHAANIANQSTPGYKARQVEFESEFQAAMQRGDSAAARAVEARVVVTGGPNDNDSNNVEVDQEVTQAAESAMLYRAYAGILRGKHALLNTAISRGA